MEIDDAVAMLRVANQFPAIEIIFSKEACAMCGPCPECVARLEKFNEDRFPAILVASSGPVRLSFSAAFDPLFDRAWSIVPAREQPKILDHGVNVFLHASTSYPQCWSPGRTENPGGHRIDFDEGRLSALPEPDWSPIVIAHELAHVYLHAVKDPLACQVDEAVEVAVERTLIGWGVERLTHQKIAEWVRLDIMRHFQQVGQPSKAKPTNC